MSAAQHWLTEAKDPDQRSWNGKESHKQENRRDCPLDICPLTSRHKVRTRSLDTPVPDTIPGTLRRSIHADNPWVNIHITTTLHTSKLEHLMST